MASQKTSAKSQNTASKNAGELQDTTFDRTLRLLTRFERFAWDIGGVIALAFALMTLLALFLPQLTRGILLSWWAGKLRVWFGWGSIWVIIITSVLGLWMLRQRHTVEMSPVNWRRILARTARWSIPVQS